MIMLLNNLEKDTEIPENNLISDIQFKKQVN